MENRNAEPFIISDFERENLGNINNSLELEIGKEGASSQVRAFRENSGTEAFQRTEMRQKLYLLCFMCYFKLNSICVES